MHFETITVTPCIAEKWLKDKNRRNRSISDKKVDAYAADMRNGRWHDTHQNAIAFYKDGNLADGQHRLAAIVRADTPLDLMVWWGLDDPAAFGIDAHRMRGTHDQIKIAGGNDWINKDIVACARMMMPSSQGRAGVVSPQQIVEFCLPHYDALTFAQDNLPRRMAPASIRAAAAMAFYHEPIDKLTGWCNVFVGGIGDCEVAKTAMTLRDRVMKEPGLSHSGAKREYLLRITMRSIQAFCAGQLLTKIYEPKERVYNVPA